MSETAQSLCFKELHDAKCEGKIELAEYLQGIVAHYRGVRHDADADADADAEEQRPWIQRGFESEVRDTVLGEGFKPLGEDEIPILYSIFLSAFQGDISALRKHLDLSYIPRRLYTSALFEIATSKVDIEIIRLCFERGHRPYARLYKQSFPPEFSHLKPAWLDLLFEFNLLRWKTSSKRLHKDIKHIVWMGPACAQWYISHGGRSDRCSDLFSKWGTEPVSYIGGETVRVLLEGFGIEWFKDSGALQLAVRERDFDTAKLLVEAGADVNEVLGWPADYREGDYTPSEALLGAIYKKNEEMVRWPVARGAKLQRKHIEDSYRFQGEYKEFGDLIKALDAVGENISVKKRYV